MHIHKPSVTIGIPAYNEEANIARLLASLIEQKQKGFHLKQIVVLSDGSQDRTVKVAKQFALKHLLVKVIEGTKRQGKGARLNELFRLSRSDIVVCLDADIRLASAYTLNHLIEPFRNPRVSLVSGNDQPLLESGWFNETTRAACELWYEVRNNINDGDSVHNIHGSVYAIRRQLYTRLRLPTDTNADDHHVYFQAIKLGHKLYFAKSARIFYRLPGTLKEYFRQHSRYLHPHTFVADYYGTWVWSYYRVPTKAKLRAIMSLLTKKPHTLFSAICLQVLLRLAKPFFVQKHSVSHWQTVTTTKFAITKKI